MEFTIKYTTEPKRILAAAIMDSRFSIPILAGLGGFEVKEYVDNQIALLVDNVLPYKIETNMGNFAGFLSLKITNMGLTAVKFQEFLRPSFLAFNDEISNIISIFISDGWWKRDFLV